MIRAATRHVGYAIHNLYARHDVSWHGSHVKFVFPPPHLTVRTMCARGGGRTRLDIAIAHHSFIDQMWFTMAVYKHKCCTSYTLHHLSCIPVLLYASGTLPIVYTQTQLSAHFGLGIYIPFHSSIYIYGAVFIYPVPYLYIRSSIYISGAIFILSVAVFIYPVPYLYIRSSIYISGAVFISSIYIVSLAVFIILYPSSIYKSLAVFIYP